MGLPLQGCARLVAKPAFQPARRRGERHVNRMGAAVKSDLVHGTRVVSIADSDLRSVDAVRQDRAVYDLLPGEPRPASLSAPTVFGAPDIVLLDLPQLREDQPAHRPTVAAHVKPWPGEIAVYRSAATDGFALLTTFSSRARMVAITRQTLINDDLDAFNRIPAMYGNSIAQLESDVVWGTRAGAIGDVDGQGLLATTKGAEVWHRPVKPGKLKQTGDQPGGLPKWQPEERLQRQAGLDRGIGEHRLTPALDGGRRAPRYRERLTRTAAIDRSFDIYYRDRQRTARMDALNAAFVGQGCLAFDIGAHVGDRTGSFSRLGASVVALEPQCGVWSGR